MNHEFWKGLISKIFENSFFTFFSYTRIGQYIMKENGLVYFSYWKNNHGFLK